MGVGSTINFKRIINHFLDCHDADHSSLKFKLIDQSHGNLRKCENFWIGMLLTH